METVQSARYTNEGDERLLTPVLVEIFQISLQG